MSVTPVLTLIAGLPLDPRATASRLPPSSGYDRDGVELVKSSYKGVLIGMFRLYNFGKQSLFGGRAHAPRRHRPRHRAASGVAGWARAHRPRPPF